MQSIPYIQPIYITDASLNENVYSMRTDTTTWFLKDLMGEFGSFGVKYQVPDYNVDKCTVVRAVCYDEKGVRSDIITEVSRCL